MGFFIFLGIFLTLYGLIHFYIFKRGWNIIPKGLPVWKAVYAAAFLIAALSFFTGRILENISINMVSKALIWTGSFWMGMMAYLFLGILLIDVLRILDRFFHFFPSAIIMKQDRARIVAGAAVFGLSLLAVIGGHINSRIPTVNTVELDVEKKVPGLKSLKIAMASDIHLGTIISNSRLEKLIRTINDLEPDIILLPGDIVDEDIKPILVMNLGDILTRLESTYGTYAATGNHEFIGGIDDAVTYLTDHGITVLRDRVIRIDNKFYVAGRDDLSVNRFSKMRKSDFAKSGEAPQRRQLNDLLVDVDCHLPVILMDHQPFSLRDVAGTCVDLQISGHTHHGQLWPFNFITSAIYEVSKGYKKIGDTHFYVSSGYGTWGPPVRTSSRPEIVEIIMNFN